MQELEALTNRQALNLDLKEQNLRVVWSPLDGSQRLIMSCPANIMLYHGTRGPGKTDAQLMRFRRNVGKGYGRFWRGIIFDREYKSLDDIISKSQRWFPEIKVAGAATGDARFLSGKSDYRWVWPTGEELLFRAVKREADYWGYHGQEFPWIGWNELTKYSNDTLFDAMMSCNRTSFRPEDHPIVIDGDYYTRTGQVRQVPTSHKHAQDYLLPELPLEVIATCNPHGVGHNWVKKRFINQAPMGKLVRRTVRVFNPRTQRKEDITKTIVHLFGSYKENKYLPPEYIADLASITDENKRRAWLMGDWDVVAGGMFDDAWDSRQHIVEPFRIPYNWRIERTFDYGSSAPFSVGWWAISDGSDVTTADGRERSTVRGDVFRIAEWYGSTGKPNQGLRLLAAKIAEGIVARELAMGLYGRVQPGAADNSIWDVDNGNCIAADMAKPVKVAGKTYPGVQWNRSDKSNGSRKAGWNKIREYLVNAKRAPGSGPREFPGLFVFNTCTDFIDLFPVLPRDEVDPDDVDTDAEDHIGDEVRYFILSRIYGPRSGRTKGM